MVNFLYFLQNRAEARYIMACAGINTVLQKSLVSPMLQRPFAGFGPVLQCFLYGQEVLPRGLTELKLYLDHAVESTWLLLNTDVLTFICI